MTDRCVVLLLASSADVTPPRGLTLAQWRLAMAEDVADMLADLDGVASVIAAVPPDEELAAAIVWPDTPVYAASTPIAALALAAEAGYSAALVLAADVPDLPSMHIGKMFRALGSHAVAAAPAAGEGLVALAAQLPAADWLVEVDPSLETTSLARLRDAAPGHFSVAGTPGWHRMRADYDIAQLDPGLEGWEATRAALGY